MLAASGADRCGATVSKSRRISAADVTSGLSAPVRSRFLRFWLGQLVEGTLVADQENLRPFQHAADEVLAGAHAACKFRLWVDRRGNVALEQRLGPRERLRDLP